MLIKRDGNVLKNLRNAGGGGGGGGFFGKIKKGGGGGGGGGGGWGGFFGKFSKRGRGCLNKRWEHNEWGCDKQQRFNLKG